ESERVGAEERLERAGAESELLVVHEQERGELVRAPGGAEKAGGGREPGDPFREPVHPRLLDLSSVARQGLPTAGLLDRPRARGRRRALDAPDRARRVLRRPP